MRRPDQPDAPAAVRTLPLLVAPMDDETLLSFCRRLAAHNEGSLSGVLKACGLGGGTHQLRVIPHMAVVLDSEVVAGIAEATGITTERADGLLLKSYRGAIDIAACPRSGGPDLLHWSRRQGLLGAGSRACPRCLRADGAFRMAWRFEWSFACPEHGLLLEASCPRCHRPYSYDDNRRPTQSSRVPSILGCGNHAPPAQARSGCGCQPCGHQFRDLPLTPSTARITDAQRRVHEIAHGSPPTIHGQNVSAKEWLVELTSLVAIVAQLGERDELGALGVAPSAAFDDYVAAGRGRGPYSPRRSGDPALLAAVVPTAVELLAASSPAEFDEALAPFVRRGFDTRFPFMNDAYKSLGIRGRTLQAWARIVGPRRRLSARLRSRYGAPDARPKGLAMLPQLLWPEVFDQRFSRFLPGIDRDLRRRFCALALGVTLTKCPYIEVAAGLGLPRSARLVERTNRLLRDRHEDDTFYQALVEADRWLEGQQFTVDYTQRRRALVDFDVISAKDWVSACSALNIRIDSEPGRRHSSTWLWCALTGGVAAHAPTFANGHDADSEQATYNRFVQDDLPALEPALVALAARELKRRGLAGPVRADLSGWRPPP